MKVSTPIDSPTDSDRPLYRPPSQISRRWRAYKKNKVFLSVAAAVLLAAGLTASIYLVRLNQDLRQRASESPELTFTTQSNSGLAPSSRQALQSNEQSYNVLSTTLITAPVPSSSLQPAFLSSSAINFPTESGLVKVIPTKIEEVGEMTHFFGIVEGEPNSLVSLVMHDGGIAGSIKYSANDYTISPLDENGSHIISLIDRSIEFTENDFDDSNNRVRGVSSDQEFIAQTLHPRFQEAPIQLAPPLPLPSPTSTPTPYRLPIVTPTPSPTPSPTPTPTLRPIASPNLIPSPTASPTDTVLPAPTPPQELTATSIRLPSAPDQAASSSEISRVKVLFVATPNADARLNNRTAARAAAAINEANYINNRSGVLVQYDLVGVHILPAAENYDPGTADNTPTPESAKLHLQRPTDGRFDEAHSLREQYSADIVGLIFNATPRWRFCGWATLNAIPDDAFFSVSTDCVNNYYVVPHEMGHLFGTNHDYANGMNTHFPYGHGYKGNGLLTVMSYRTSGGSEVRIPYFSTGSQNIRYNDHSIGNPVSQDNVKVLNERRFSVSNFKGNDGGLTGAGCVAQTSCSTWRVTCSNGSSFSESNCFTQDNFRCVWGIENSELRWKFEACHNNGGVPGYGGGDSGGEDDPNPSGHGCPALSPCGQGAECAFPPGGSGCDPGLICANNPDLGYICYDDTGGSNPPPPPECNPNNLTMTTSQNIRVGDDISFSLSGSEGDLHVGDSWSGGVDCSGGFWGNKTCKATAQGDFTWTHSWKKCQQDNVSNCSDTCSKSVNFSVSQAASPPSQPTNLSPVGNYTCGANSVTFSWDRPANATGFALRINDTTNGWDNGCSNPNNGDTCSTISGRTYTRQVVPGRRYDWWIHSVNEHGQSTAASASFTIPESCRSTLSSIHQTAPESVPGSISKQDHVSSNGSGLITRIFEHSIWQNWANYSTAQISSPIGTIRSFSQSNVPGTSTHKQDLLSADGSRIYYRTFQNGSWGTWSTMTVSNVGLPNGISKVAAYSMTNGDSATNNRPKQHFLTSDGRTIYFRFYENGRWQNWLNVSVSNLGIPGLSQIRSFTQSNVPGRNMPKQEVLTVDGTKIWYRFYQNSNWGQWNSYQVSSLKIPGRDQQTIPLPQ